MSSRVWRVAGVIYFYLVISVCCTESDRQPKKRQIYREQVLPHAGGRIPDTAFETDRLFLNQLQKDGISLPDGVVPEQRNPQVYPYFNRPSRTVFRIALSSDGRYTVDAGRLRYRQLPSVETTYLYPQIHGQVVTFTPRAPQLPVYKQLQLFNPLLNPINLQPKKKAHFLDVTPKNGKTNSKSFRTQSFQNFNILNAPLTPLTFQAPHSGPHSDGFSAFNDFDALFGNFNFNGNSNRVRTSGHNANAFKALRTEPRHN